MPDVATIVWSVIAGVGGLLIAIVGYFLKRTMSSTDRHETEINHIKQTYVTKEEVKELKGELRQELKQLSDAVSEIRDKVLYREDYYRTMVDTNRNIENLRELLIDRLGGGPHGN